VSLLAIKIHPVLTLAMNEVRAVVIEWEARLRCFTPKTLILFSNACGAVLFSNEV
jgi:hypothetical protein